MGPQTNFPVELKLDKTHGIIYNNHGPKSEKCPGGSQNMQFYDPLVSQYAILGPPGALFIFLGYNCKIHYLSDVSG